MNSPTLTRNNGFLRNLNFLKLIQDLTRVFLPKKKSPSTKHPNQFQNIRNVFSQNEMKTINLILPFISSRQYSSGALIKIHRVQPSAKAHFNQKRQNKCKPESRKKSIQNYLPFFNDYHHPPLVFFLRVENSQKPQTRFQKGSSTIHTFRRMKLQMPAITHEKAIG